jgi:TRAP-type C4-dicarboxylate transport system permease small subunit
MIAMVLATTAQIVFRVFFKALPWSEELSRYLLVWATFLGSSMAYKRGSHISITFLSDLVPLRVRAVLKILVSILSIVFFLSISYYGYMMIKTLSFQISPGLSLRMQYVYLAIPLSLIIMTIHALADIANDLTAWGKGELR